MDILFVWLKPFRRLCREVATSINMWLPNIPFIMVTSVFSTRRKTRVSEVKWYVSRWQGCCLTTTLSLSHECRCHLTVAAVHTCYLMRRACHYACPITPKDIDRQLDKNWRISITRKTQMTKTFKTYLKILKKCLLGTTCIVVWNRQPYNKRVKRCVSPENCNLNSTV